MLFSYQWLKEFVPQIPAPEELMRELTVHAVEVEGLHAPSAEWSNIVVGHIKSVEAHPNADKLRVCQVDVGETTEQIVCGGVNLSEGMKVVVAKVGSRVKWHGEGELITLASVKLRGVESNGMICSSDEVGLADMFPKKDEKEVLDLSHLNALPGTPLAEALGMNDVMIEIDNKSMTHRADLFSHYFMAREIAAVFDLSMEDRLAVLPVLPSTSGTVQVKITDNDDCKRYLAIELEVTVGTTPAEIVERLQACGMKSINNVVDVTNYVMLELGQPLHAFDADTLKGNIQVRRATAGEKLAALDHTEKKLNEQVLVIADDEKAIGVAGVLGGAHSGITEHTKRIIVEVATFDPVTVRRSAQAIGVRTDSALRFEKGLTPALVPYAAQRAVQLLMQHAQATVKGITDVYPAPVQPWTIDLPLTYVKTLTGKKWSAKEVTTVLARLGIETTQPNSRLLTVTPPWFRKDVRIPEDVIEELVRIAGIDHIPEQKMTGVLEVPQSEPELQWVRRIKHTLASVGLYEVSNYSFYGEDLIKKVGLQSDKEHVEVMNPLSDELRYLRVSVFPRMLETVARNQFQKESFGLFEVGHVYFADREVRQLGIVVMDAENAYRQLRGNVEAVMSALHLRYDTAIVNKTAECEFWNFYDGHQALQIKIDDEIIGTLGVLHPTVAAACDIKKTVAFATLSIPVMSAHATRVHRSLPLSPYPAIPLDLSIVVDQQVPWSAIEAIVRTHGKGLLTSLELFDIYTGSKIPDGKKSVAFHLVLQSTERTLEMKEVEKWRDAVMKELGTELKATLRDT